MRPLCNLYHKHLMITIDWKPYNHSVFQYLSQVQQSSLPPSLSPSQTTSRLLSLSPQELQQLQDRSNRFSEVLCVDEDESHKRYSSQLMRASSSSATTLSQQRNANKIVELTDCLSAFAGQTEFLDEKWYGHIY